MEVLQEAVVSSNSAFPCLVLLSARNGFRADAAAVRYGSEIGANSLPLSRLIEIAGEFGLRARYVYRDWGWLEQEAAHHPILLLLKNTNVVVALGSGRVGVEEIAVSDPLHRDGEVMVLPRQDLERAWGGDALTIDPQPPGEKKSGNIGDQPGQQWCAPAEGRLGGVTKRLSLVIRLCLGLFALISAAAIPIASKLANDWGPATSSPETMPLNAAPSGYAVAQTQSVTAVADAGIGNTIALAAVGGGAVGLTSAAETARGAATFPNLKHQSELATSLAALAPEALPKGPGAKGAEPERTPLTESPVAELEALIVRGDDHLRTGDISAARLFYERAADAGGADAALRLGETFDPVFLDRIHLPSVMGNMERAVFWYRRAGDLGSSAAKILLKQLDGK